MNDSKNRTFQKPIILTGVRQNNLKNISLEIPKKTLTVITGLSGSGKSSLAFDTLYAEGQRRYIESLSTYTRQFLDKMPKPELDLIQNIPPAIALEQKNSIVNSRSTVGTQTEIIDYLRVLFARIGETKCVQCGGKVYRFDTEHMVQKVIEAYEGKKFLILSSLITHHDDLQTHAPDKKKKIKKPKAKTKKEIALDLKLQLEWLLKSGISRIAVKENDDLQVYETEEFLNDFKTHQNTHSLETVFPIFDRLKLPQKSELTKDDLTRLTGSIDHALQFSHEKVLFYSPDRKENDPLFLEFNREFACETCRRIHRVPEPLLFSFNSPIGACDGCNGFGYNLELDEKCVIPNPALPLKSGAIDPFTKPSFSDWQKELLRFCAKHKIPIDKRYIDLSPSQKKLIWKGDGEDKNYPGIEEAFNELNAYKYKIYVRVFIRRYQDQRLCSVCKGARLHEDAIAVKCGGKSISEVLDLPIDEAFNWLKSLKLNQTQKKLAEEAYSQIEKRLSLLIEVGVSYLTLSRLAKTLSGGEFQRINLATQLGNGLCGTLYVLDEPSIGLHASDTERLIGVLKKLRDTGNTVVVVEHDLEMMRAADHIIELGPLAGKNGGYLVAEGNAEEIRLNEKSLTGQYLTGKKKLTPIVATRKIASKWIELTGCRENNLKNINVKFPLHRLSVVTGLSGSGKSTLVHQTLFKSLDLLFSGTETHEKEDAGRYDKLYGADQIRGVVLLDQSPIGKSSRSNPATYLKAWDEVRRIYANQTLAVRRGLSPQHFSFNVDGGRCPVCKGEGEITIDMHFMAEMKLVCEECEGKRFKRNILEITVKGKNIYELLCTTLDEAYEMFRDNPILSRKFGILREVGLGYLQVGQSATTLSGGESQRLKIAATLEDRSKSNLLYLFDEPTTGLHLEDIQRLMRVIQDLVESGNTCLMIEHHLDLIAQADWVIDLGPGGGLNGGALVAEGTPESLVKNIHSVTGKLLQPYFPEALLPRNE